MSLAQDILNQFKNGIEKELEQHQNQQNEVLGTLASISFTTGVAKIILKILEAYKEKLFNLSKSTDNDPLKFIREIVEEIDSTLNSPFDEALQPFIKNEITREKVVNILKSIFLSALSGIESIANLKSDLLKDKITSLLQNTGVDIGQNAALKIINSNANALGKLLRKAIGKFFLKEQVKSLIRKQLEEMSTTAGVGGYLTSKAFSPSKSLKNAATKYAMKMGWKLAGGMPKKSKVLDYKELWKGKKSAMNENNNQPTLQDILDKKGSLDHLNNLAKTRALYVKTVPDGEGGKFISYNGKVVKVDLDFTTVGKEKESVDFTPGELVLDVERNNMMESLKKLIKQELLNEVTYSKFKKEVKHRTKSEQLHKAIREVKKKLQEIDRIVEYTSRMKQELSEDEGGISYWKATQNNIGTISEMVNQLNNKIKNLHQ